MLQTVRSGSKRLYMWTMWHKAWWKLSNKVNKGQVTTVLVITESNSRPIITTQENEISTHLHENNLLKQSTNSKLIFLIIA